MSAIEELRKVPMFADLAEDQLAWLAEHASFRDIEAGDVVSREGDPADTMMAVIYGELRARREQKKQGAADAWLYVWKSGEITGMLPFSRMTRLPVTVRATSDTRLAAFPASVFPEMLARIPVLAERLVRITIDRARLAVRDEEQNQSLAALGKIAAGLAHELYNPTAAVLRAAGELRRRFQDVRRCSINLAEHRIGGDALGALASFDRREAANLARSLNPVERSEREDRVGEWLDDRNIESAWTLAETFVSAGMDIDDLERIAAVLPEAARSDGFVWLESLLAADSLIRDIESASTRIAGLVDSVKSYSYLDRVPDKVETDIHAALESTLAIFAHDLRAKSITVVRDYHPNLPRVVMHAGEMNQVWTNLIDNAIDAVPDGGQITIRTFCEAVHVLVEIIDNGPGIPKEIQSRIWEPFFTTKDVGKGTGLGLDIVRRIVVRRHDGEICVDSVPGRTCFQVRLPRNPSELS